MANVYAVREDNGERVLVAIHCDRCDNTIKPNPDIPTSGWVKYGQDNGLGTTKVVETLCPECDSRRA